MATEEELSAEESAKLIEKSRELVEMWASMTDAFLQEWLAKAAAADRLGSVIASIKLAQLGRMIELYFKDMGKEFIQSPTELKAARQAVEQVHAQVAARVAAFHGGEPVSPEKNPSLN